MAFDHSHVITDLTIEEVTNLPTGLDIDGTKLYFRTNDQLYYRPLEPVSDEEPGQATYLIQTFGRSVRGLRVTIAESIAALENSNSTEFTVRVSGTGSTATVDVKPAETPPKVEVVFGSAATLGTVKAAIDAATGLTSEYVDGGATGDTPSASVGKASGGVAMFDLVPAPRVNGYVYARAVLGDFIGSVPGGGGGGGGGDPITFKTIKPAYFHAPINAVANAAIPTSATNFLGITIANVYDNQGSAFEVEDSTTRQRIKVLKAGNYTLKAFVALDTPTSGSVRTIVVAAFDITRGGLAIAGSAGADAKYIRANADLGTSSVFRALTLELDVDDLIEFDIHQTGNDNFPALIGGDGSTISIIENVGTVEVDGGGGAIFDVSVEGYPIIDEGSLGSVYLDYFNHDLSYAVRTFHAATAATGTGTEVSTVDYITNHRPAITADDEIWYKPNNDSFYVSELGVTWFLLSSPAIIGLRLEVPITGYTAYEYLGHRGSAAAAANAIPAADYLATTQYLYYNEQTQKVEYLSAYTAPGTQVESVDLLHVQTSEDRVTPHGLNEGFSGTLSATANQVFGHEYTVYRDGVGRTWWGRWVTGSFALHIPEQEITGLTAAAAGTASNPCVQIVDSTAVGNNAGVTGLYVRFGQTVRWATS